MNSSELELVTELLGREPQGSFEVVVRDDTGAPVVMWSAPHLRDGTPMPTTYWLIGRGEREAVSRLEAAGGVKEAEAFVAPDELAAAHAAYARERQAFSATEPLNYNHEPSGGVGGTRRGVKCLHAHLAWYLAGGDDPVGRYTAGRLGLRRAAYSRKSLGARPADGPAAAVDCGSNSTRLLVVDSKGRRIERQMTITRLGAGVGRTGRLGEEAVARTLSVLRGYGELLERLGVDATRRRATATSAVRDASNAEEFLEAAGGLLGTRPEVIAGSEEGRLSFKGATASLDPAEGPYLVVDIGGGSTELASSPGGTDEVLVSSLQVGCVRLSEAFFWTDPPSGKELGAARDEVRRLIEGALLADPPAGQCFSGAARLVGLAGTVSALAVMILGLDGFVEEKVNHARLSRRAVAEIAGELSGLSVAERRARHGMEKERADVIVGGAVVLEEVMDHFSFEELVASEEDILDAMAAEVLAGEWEKPA